MPPALLLSGWVLLSLTFSPLSFSLDLISRSHHSLSRVTSPRLCILSLTFFLSFHSHTSWISLTLFLHSLSPTLSFSLHFGSFGYIHCSSLTSFSASLGFLFSTLRSLTSLSLFLSAYLLRFRFRSFCPLHCRWDFLGLVSLVSFPAPPALLPPPGMLLCTAWVHLHLPFSLCLSFPRFSAWVLFCHCLLFSLLWRLGHLHLEDSTAGVGTAAALVSAPLPPAIHCSHACHCLLRCFLSGVCWVCWSLS